MSHVFFLTASGTDVGKTTVATILAHNLRRENRAVIAYKPIATGIENAWAMMDEQAVRQTDTGRLAEACGLTLTPETLAMISPFCFREPLAPSMAALAERTQVDYPALLQWSQQTLHQECHDVTLIEGVGGVMVPLDARHTTLDWMVACGLPVLLVVGTYLGALSHALTAHAALVQRGLIVRAVLVHETAGSSVSFPDTYRELQNHLPYGLVMTVESFFHSFSGVGS